MGNQIAIGVGAGLAAALLYGSVGYSTPVAIVLFYISSLPLFIAVLGWGWATVALGALTGAIASGLALTALAGLIFLLAVGAPAVWLSYLAGLSRTVATPSGQAQEFYPLGRIVVWTAAIAGILVLISVAAFGFSLETYEKSVRDILAHMLEREGPSAPLPGGADADSLAGFFVRYVPRVSVVVWMGTTLANMYFAARAVQISGRLRRPWPQISRFELPARLPLVLAALLATSFLPGMAGLLADAASAGLIFAYTLLGLAIMHTVTRYTQLRTLILGLVYFAIIFLGWSALVLNWPALLLALLGLAETPLGLRARADALARARGRLPARRHDNDDFRQD